MADALRIRPGTVRDARTIYTMLRGLAAYERLLSKFRTTVARVRRDGFGRRRHFHTLICWSGRIPVGIAVYFFTYSTFAARPALYLEDVFVWPRRRGRGAGKALLAALARIAVTRGCTRMEWTVLDWNRSAIRFYERLGATVRREWLITALAGPPLRRLAESFTEPPARQTTAQPGRARRPAHGRAARRPQRRPPGRAAVRAGIR